MSNETTNIPLNKLIPWDGNVRRTGVADGIDELAASITAHGLLQSLVVRPAEDKRKRGKYEIVAGRRRYLALKALVKKRVIAKDYPVPCNIAENEVNAAELSLAENVMRMPMHPADQFEAFRDLADEGVGVADIAARFGVSESLILKRLKLGRVSSAILDAYREDKLGLEQVQAFAITDDTEAQDRVWNDLPPWSQSPGAIKRILTVDEIPASDKRARLIGLDAYEAAGGAVRRDLFDAQDSGYVLDAVLLDNLVTKALEEAADEVRREGWNWVEIIPDIDYDDLREFRRFYPERVPLPKKNQAELTALSEEYDELVDTDDDADIERLAEIERRIDELEASAELWDEEMVALGGAIVSIGYEGDIRVERGLLRPEHIPAIDGTDDDAPSAAAPSSEEPAIRMPARLIEDLSAQKSAAISAELVKRPDIALAAVAHSLLLTRLYCYLPPQSCVELGCAETKLRDSLYSPEDCKGLIALEAEGERWDDRIPGDPAHLWEWCLAQPQDVLLEVLALIAARAVNAVIPRKGAPNAHADVLAKALSLDMSDYFTPTADNFFSRISAADIQAVLCEARGVSPAPAWAKMKKAELATFAEREIAGTGWLPESVRIADDSDTASDGGDDNEVAESDPLPEATE